MVKNKKTLDFIKCLQTVFGKPSKLDQFRVALFSNMYQSRDVIPLFFYVFVITILTAGPQIGLLDNGSRPLHDGLVSHRSEFSTRLILPRNTTEWQGIIPSCGHQTPHLSQSMDWIFFDYLLHMVVAILCNKSMIKYFMQ